MKAFKLMKNIIGDFDDLRPFIFQPAPPKYSMVKGDDTGIILACPFPLFSIEIDGAFALATDEEDGIFIDTIICKETSPGEYTFMVGFLRDQGDIYPMLVDHRIPAYHRILSLVEIFIRRIHDSKIGLLDKTGVVSYKHNKKKKKQYVIKDVIYVSKDKKATATKSNSGNNIRWTEGFDVRAHWRKLMNEETMGKDRLGERTVRGWTWVKSHVRGDDDAVVSKPRIIH